MLSALLFSYFIYNCFPKPGSRIWKTNVKRLLNLLFIFQETNSGAIVSNDLGFWVLPVRHSKFHGSKMNMWGLENLEYMTINRYRYLFLCRTGSTQLQLKYLCRIITNLCIKHETINLLCQYFCLYFLYLSFVNEFHW